MSTYWKISSLQFNEHGSIVSCFKFSEMEKSPSKVKGRCLKSWRRRAGPKAETILKEGQKTQSRPGHSGRIWRNQRAQSWVSKRYRSGFRPKSRRTLKGPQLQFSCRNWISTKLVESLPPEIPLRLTSPTFKKWCMGTARLPYRSTRLWEHVAL